jgi:tRNA(fMet)-specific endonuclease VapC
MHLLDTDTLTHLHAGHPKVIEWLQNTDDLAIGITIITKIEVLRGRMDFVLKAETGADLLRAQRLLERTEELLAQILLVSLNSEATEQFDRLSSTRKLSKIGRADLLIASIALANQAILVTRNLRHFRQIPNLTVANWVD